MVDNVSLRPQVRYTRKLCEGWLEHKTHRANGSIYNPYWLVLKGDILYIFKTRETTVNENLIGSLTIDSTTQFKPDVGGDAKTGYKFDLNTYQRRNRFKSKKLSERELWRGYIMGVATNKVPDDLDLLESQVEKIRADVLAYKTGEPLGPNNRVSMISGDSSDSGVEGSMLSGFSGRRTIPESQTGSGGRSSGGSGGSGGGPTMVHKFYRDMSSEQSPPSWFFSGCSREKAQEILTKHSNYGNTLMRESTSHMQSGSYVISKRVWDKDEDAYVFEHFEVMRVAGGYRLNVQNEHTPMRCLSDVMEYFKETSGGSTRLMDTNDPYRVGMPKNPESLYDKQIRRMDPEPWTWPPPGTEGEEDYEDPMEPSAPQPRYPGGGANTVTPGILKSAKSPGSKKTVDFYRNTYGGGKDRPYPKTTMDEIADLSNTAASLRHFDNMIDGFETDNVYVNDDPMTNPDLDRVSMRSVPREQMPLPPTPHSPVNHSYINEESGTIDSLPLAPLPPSSPKANTFVNNAHDNPEVIQSLPVAPPPPRVQSAFSDSAKPDSPLKVSSTNNIRENIGAIPIPPPPPPIPAAAEPKRKLEVKLPIKVSKSPPKTAPKPSSTQSPLGQRSAISRMQSTKQSQVTTPKVNHTTTSPDMLSDINQKRAQLKKTMSEGSGLGNKINTRTPDSMPTWDTGTRPQDGLIRHSNEVPVSQSDNRMLSNEQQTSGVDESNPGGVQNLSKMFEKSTQIKKSVPATREKTPQRPGNRRANTPDNRKSAPVMMSFRHDYLHPSSFTNSNIKTEVLSRLSVTDNEFTNRTALGIEALTSKQTSITDIEDFYDDTAILGPLQAARTPGVDRLDGNQEKGSEKRLNGMDDSDNFTPPSVEALSRRRQTDPGPLLHKTEGFNASFKRKLEGVLAVPKCPGSPTKIDHEYEELPIKPDAVTYANEIDF